MKSKNPRRARTTYYDSINDSIDDSIRTQMTRHHPLTVTRYPDGNCYVNVSGGDTRLRVLIELSTETGIRRQIIGPSDQSK